MSKLEGYLWSSCPSQTGLSRFVARGAGADTPIVEVTTGWYIVMEVLVGKVVLSKRVLSLLGLTHSRSLDILYALYTLAKPSQVPLRANSSIIGWRLARYLTWLTCRSVKYLEKRVLCNSLAGSWAVYHLPQDSQPSSRIHGAQIFAEEERLYHPLLEVV